MIRKEIRWLDVEPGYYVRDPEGKTWKVESWTHITAILRDRAGNTTTIHPHPYEKVIALRPGVEDVLKMIDRTFPGAEIIHDTKDAK